MRFELKQVNATGNGSSTTCFIVENPRMENGLCYAELVGTFAEFSNEGEYIYKESDRKTVIVGGNFTMIEYNKELISDSSQLFK